MNSSRPLAPTALLLYESTSLHETRETVYGSHGSKFYQFTHQESPFKCTDYRSNVCQERSELGQGNIIKGFNHFKKCIGNQPRAERLFASTNSGLFASLSHFSLQ
jgi:hypothetical protein